MAARAPTKNPALGVHHWSIDPASGDDRRSGVDDAHALATFRELVLGRYGTLSPVLSTDVTIDLLSSQPDTSDRLVFRPIMVEGARLYLNGKWTLLASGTFTSVTPGSTSAADGRWQANLGSAATGHLATRGLVVVNTTRAASMAQVHQVLSGTTVALTHPADASAPTTPNIPNFNPAWHIDWQAGDSWSLYQLPTLYLAEFDPTTIASNSSSNSVFCYATHLYVPDPAVPGTYGNTDVILGKGVCLFESFLDTYAIYPTSDFVGDSQGVNTCFAGGGEFRYAVLIGGSLGDSNGLGFASLETTVLDGGIIVSGPVTFNGGSQVGALVGGPGCFMSVAGQFVHAAYVAGLYATQLTGTYSLGPGGIDSPDNNGHGQCVYTAPAASHFLGVPTLALDGVSVAIAEDTSLEPVQRHPNRALTPAQLDASIASGGFGSVAHGYLGSTFTVEFVPTPSTSPFIAGVAGGGTGRSYITPHAVLVGEGLGSIGTVGLGTGQILVGQAVGDPQAETVSGDASLNASGVLTVAPSGVSAGTYGDSSHVARVTVNSKGFVTTATSVAIAFPTGLAPGGTAGGDLGLSYPNPEVVGLLTKVLPSLPGSDQYLHYTGSAWAFSALPTSFPPSGTAGGDLSLTYPNPEVVGLLTKALPALATGFLFYSGSAWSFASISLSSIQGSGATPSQVPSWNGSVWVPSNLPSSGPTGWSITQVAPVDIGDAATHVISTQAFTAPSAGYFVVQLNFHFQNKATPGASVFFGLGINITGFDLQWPLSIPAPFDLDTGVFYSSASMSYRHHMTGAGSVTFYALAKADAVYGSGQIWAGVDMSVEFFSS